MMKKYKAKGGGYGINNKFINHGVGYRVLKVVEKLYIYRKVFKKIISIYII
jgi:hypothetical protein